MQQRNSRPRLNGNERVKATRRVRRLYESGKDIRAVALHCGYTYTLTRTLLIESGATIRTKGGWGVTRGL